MTTESTKQITFRIQRYDPEKDSAPHLQEFIVPSSRGMTVLDGLIYIKENLDSTLTLAVLAVCQSAALAPWLLTTTRTSPAILR